MKKIFTLSIAIVLFSSFLSGDYFSNTSRNPLKPYDSPFPLIDSQDGKYTAYYPDALKPDPSGDAATNSGTFRIWYENGTGNYTTILQDGQAVGLSATNARYDAIMMASRLYENPRRPPGTSAKFLKDETLEKVNTSDMLSAGSQIKLFTPVPHVVSADPVVFAISYKLREKKHYRILLKYNHDGSGLDNVFTPLNAGDQVDIPTASLKPGSADQYVLSSNKIPQLRNFAGEEIFYHLAGNNILDQRSLTASAKPDTELKQPDDAWKELQFKNAVVVYGLAADTQVHNIFITLLPPVFDGTAVKANPKVFVEAVLQENTAPIVKESNAAYNDIETSRVQDVVSDAHDPNGVSVSPECLLLSQNVTSLHYKIDFENTGNGDADSVLVAFTPPANCVVKSITVNSVTCGRTGGACPNSLFTAYNRDENGHIIFPVKGTLKGSYVNTKTEPDPQTKGSIEFNMEITPNNGAKELKAWADIFFHSANGDTRNDMNRDTAKAMGFPQQTIGYEHPVTTVPARAFYKDQCGKEVPHFPWWWLLLIAFLLLLLVLWLAFRRPGR